MDSRHQMIRKPSKKDRSQRVTIRIWLPSYDRRRKLGHVSLETHIGGENNSGNHISFWPKESIQKRNLIKSVKGEMKSLAHDKIEEQSPPDFKIYLYDLDIEKINQEFSALKEKDIDWWLLGSFFLSPEIKKNCAGLVYELLQKGGINQLNYPKTLLYLLAGSVLNIAGSAYFPYSILRMLSKQYMLGSQIMASCLIGTACGFYLTKQSKITNGFKLNYTMTLSALTGYGVTFGINVAIFLLFQTLTFAAFLPMFMMLMILVMIVSVFAGRPGAMKELDMAAMIENFGKIFISMAIRAEKNAIMGGVLFGTIPSLLVLTNFIKLHFLDKSILSPNDVKNFCLLKADQEKQKYESIKASIAQGKLPDEKNNQFILAYEKDEKKIKEIKATWKDTIYRKTIANKWFIPVTTSVSLTATGFGLFYVMKKSNILPLPMLNNTLKLTN